MTHDDYLRRKGEHRQNLEYALNSLSGCQIVDAELVDDGGITLRLFHPQAKLYRHVLIDDCTKVDVSPFFYTKDDEVELFD